MSLIIVGSFLANSLHAKKAKIYRKEDENQIVYYKIMGYNRDRKIKCVQTKGADVPKYFCNYYKKVSDDFLPEGRGMGQHDSINKFNELEKEYQRQ